MTYWSMHLPDDPMPERSNHHFQHWLHITTQASGIITLTLTIWDQVHQQLKQDDKQQTPLYIANSDIKAIKCTVSLNSIDGVLSPHQIRQLQVSPYIKEHEHEEVGMRLPQTMPVNQTADQEEHVLSQSAATQAHYDTDEQGLPIQVLYYSYSDLGLVLSTNCPNPHMIWINVLFYPACQLQLNTGQLPSPVAFPDSKGYADMALNWLGSWLPGGQLKQFTQFKEQHWVGDSVKIIEINHKMDEE